MRDSKTSTDYDALWEEQMQRPSFRGDGVAFWDETARRCDGAAQVSDYNDRLIERMALSPDASLLDVGCGTGGLTFALAARVRQVTSLDISPAMLDILKRDSADLGLKNIQAHHQDWSRVEIVKDIPMHDIVIASRSLPMGNLRQTLTKLDQAARRACYATWPASGNEADAALSAVLGRDYYPTPDYNLIARILETLGIKAEIETFGVTGRSLFPDLATALAHSLRGRKLNASLEERARAFLRRQFVLRDGGYYRETESLWALISWHKNESGY
jgi:SAM-dependent methyltransferase